MPITLVWLALGAFAIGTEGFVISGLLPSVAADLRVSVGTAGQLVSIFGISYAVGAPVLAALCGAMDRRRVLNVALSAFALANVVAAGAQ